MTCLSATDRVCGENSHSPLLGEYSEGGLRYGSFLSELRNFLPREHPARRKPQSLTLTLSVQQSCSHPFRNERTLPLRNRADDLKQHFTMRQGSVYGLSARNEINV